MNTTSPIAFLARLCVVCAGLWGSSALAGPADWQALAHAAPTAKTGPVAMIGQALAYPVEQVARWSAELQSDYPEIARFNQGFAKALRQTEWNLRTPVTPESDDLFSRVALDEPSTATSVYPTLGGAMVELTIKY
jgi:hypothetical protein